MQLKLDSKVKDPVFFPNTKIKHGVPIVDDGGGVLVYPGKPLEVSEEQLKRIELSPVFRKFQDDRKIELIVEKKKLNDKTKDQD